MHFAERGARRIVLDKRAASERRPGDQADYRPRLDTRRNLPAAVVVVEERIDSVPAVIEPVNDTLARCFRMHLHRYPPEVHQRHAA
jgi:hypothetical protein